MNQTYFFKNDGRCSFVNKVLNSDFIKQHMGKNTYNNIKYYINLQWSSINGKGVEKGFLDKVNIGSIHHIDDLPEGAGLYVSAYDGNPEVINRLKNEGVPVIESVCPWMIALRKQLKKISNDYQCIIMLDKDHMVYKNYKSLFPENTIFITIENYMKVLNDLSIEKPVHFLVYSTFRKKDAQEVMEYINSHYHYNENVFWLKGICGWMTKSGIFEEIRNAVLYDRLDEIWIICSNDSNRSVKSLIYEIRESGAAARIISNLNDIPEKIKTGIKIGVLRAPIPFSREVEIIDKIKQMHNL